MKKIILSAIVFVGAMTLNAQDEAPKLSVSGTVDAVTATLLNSRQMGLELPGSVGTCIS